MPSSTRLSLGGPSTVPSLTTQTLLAAASLRKPSRNITVSSAPASKLIWRANTAPSRLVLLIWAFSQRKSSAVTQATPLRALLWRGRPHRVGHREHRGRDVRAA